MMNKSLHELDAEFHATAAIHLVVDRIKLFGLLAASQAILLKTQELACKTKLKWALKSSEKYARNTQ
jgi:hypothetical protein